MMKIIFSLLVMFSAPSLFATTWYVRTDGGTPYTNATNTPNGQCNGTSDQPYPDVTNQEWEPQVTYAPNAEIADNQGYIEKTLAGGVSGTTAIPSWGATTTDGTVTWTRQGLYKVNQPCAMKALDYLWADQTTGGKTWMIAGGDTVYVRAGSYRAGWKSAWGITDPNCAGDAQNCFMPPPPAGTSSVHTQIIGAGSASTEIHGGWGASTVLGFRAPGTQYAPINVDVTGISIDDHSPCGLSSQQHSCRGDAFGSSWAISSNVATVQTQTTVSITGWSIVTTGTAPNTYTTVTFQTAPQSLYQSLNVAISGLTVGSFFNGHTVGVSSATSTSFVVAYESYMGADNSATENGTGTIVNTLVPGHTVMLSGFTTGSFFNNRLVSVTAATPTQFQFNWTHADASATETGHATITEDYVINGIEQNNYACNKTYTDVNIHGTAHDAIYGTQCNDTTHNLVMIANPDSGGDFDDGGGASSVMYGMNYNYDLISAYNGCAEEWPQTYPSANSVGDCTDQDNGGYGDGIGTNDSSLPGSGFICIRCQFMYNTQDGMDLLHLYTFGECDQCIGYGNMGNQLKLGGTSVIRSSQVTTNCRAMSKPAFGPFTATYNAHLDLFCRANGSAIAIRADDSFSPAPQIQGNTFVARDGPIGLEVDALTSCTTASCAVNYRDNVFIGFLNPSAGSLAVPLYVDPPIPNQVFSNTGGANDHNSTFWPGSAGNSCPDSGFFATNMLCTDPGLVGVSTFPETGYDNVAPVSGSSAVVGAGVTISGLSVDYTGATRPSPPSMGALEYITNIIRHLFGGSSSISGSGSIN